MTTQARGSGHFSHCHGILVALIKVQHKNNHGAIRMAKSKSDQYRHRWDLAELLRNEQRKLIASQPLPMPVVATQQAMNVFSSQLL